MKEQYKRAKSMAVQNRDQSNAVISKTQMQLKMLKYEKYKLTEVLPLRDGNLIEKKI